MDLHLIIAEDNAEFATLLARKAELKGWIVTVCSDGAELLATLPGIDGPGLVVVDMNMPNMDGVQAMRELNRSKPAQRFRFCMMTGGDHVNTVAARMIAEAGDLPVAQSLYKPFSLEVFGTFLDEQARILKAV